MDLALAAVVAAPALAIGSFLNVLASRIPQHVPIGGSRSACMACASPIRWYDNIPLLSYIALRGHCRDCDARIPIRYPLVEAGTVVLTVACFARFGLTAEALLSSFFCAVLVTVSAIDLEAKIVPNRIVIPAAGITLVAHTLIDPSLEWAAASAAAFGVFFAIALINPRGMGMGDVKLCLLLGAMLGWPVFLAIFIALVAGSIPALVLAFRHGLYARKVAIPFAPFLAFGSVVTLLLGGPIIAWYQGFLA